MEPKGWEWLLPLGEICVPLDLLKGEMGIPNTGEMEI